MRELELNELRIVPLGGLGEIGLNMMVLEMDGGSLVVDCGLMFPGDQLPGVDYVIPDFTYLLDKKDDVKGIVLTHGHEDHIGALPFFIPLVSAPIYATPLTIGMVREKLAEYSLENAVPLEPVNAGDVIDVGPFNVEFIRVSHSIADCVALAVKTRLGTLVHTGDFKLDPYPIDGKRVDLAAFARLGEEGVLALMSDSTNVEKEGYTLSEREVGKALNEVFAEAKGRLILATFASNIHRIQQVIDVAGKFGRKVAVLGRSMEANTKIGVELGYLDVKKGVMVDPFQVGKLPPEKVVLLTTGTQGEPLSGLARMARDEHRQIRIMKGDTVVLSSRFIPGNERAIGGLINEFYRRGAKVIYEKVSDIHVSGHASQEELKLMIALTRPEYFIPVHGEYRHLVKHAELAVKMGIPSERVLLAEDGDLILFNKVGGEKMGRIDAGKQVVDGRYVADSGDEVLAERRRLGNNGVLVVVATVDMEDGELAGRLEFRSKGLLFEDEDKSILDSAARRVEMELMALPREARLDKDRLEKEILISLKRYVKKYLKRFPVIVPVVVEF